MTLELIQSYILYRRSLALRLIVLILVGVALLLGSLYYLKSSILAFIFLVVTLLPVLFIQPLMKIFTRRIEIKRKPTGFSVSVTRLNGAENESKDYALDQVATYCIQFLNRRILVIKFNFKSAKSIEYSFYRRKQFEGQSDTSELLALFSSIIKDYNTSVSKSKQICFVPSFMASSWGLFWIVFLIVLFMAAIALHILYQPKTSPVSLFLGLAIIVQLLSQRRADLNYYKKMR